MASHRSSRRALSGAWPLLLVIPTVIGIILVLPELGEQREGLLPELLGTHFAYTERFAEFAVEARRWGIVLLLLSIVIGIVFWYVTLSTWRRKLRRYQAFGLMHFRARALLHSLLAALTMVALTWTPPMTVAEWRTIPVWSVIYFALGCGALASLQHFVTIWGITSSRRMYWGK